MDNLPIDIRTKENRNDVNLICACYGATFFRTSLWYGTGFNWGWYSGKKNVKIDESKTTGVGEQNQ